MTTPHDAFNTTARSPALNELVTAASKDDLECVRQLLAAGADINEKIEANGFTAIIMAAFCGRPEIARLLLDKGAEIDACDKTGTSATDWAKKNGHPDIAIMIEETRNIRQRQAIEAEKERSIHLAAGPLQHDIPMPKTIRFGRDA